MFAAVQAVLLNPFGFANQDRLVVLWQTDLRRALPVIEVAHGEAADWAARSRVVDGMAVFGSVNWRLSLAGTGTPESLSMAAVSAPFFRALGVTPLMGRAFDAGDEVGPRPRAAVISHGLWTRRFGRDPHILRQVLRTQAHADAPRELIPIVGVLPAGFDFPRGAEVWLPAEPLVRSAAADFTRGDEGAALRWLRVFFAVARLQTGRQRRPGRARTHPRHAHDRHEGRSRASDGCRGHAGDRFSRRAGKARALGAARRHDPVAAGRVCECGGPAGVPRRSAATIAGHPHRDRRVARASHRADRVRDGRRHGRRSRRGAGDRRRAAARSRGAGAHRRATPRAT